MDCADLRTDIPLLLAKELSIDECHRLLNHIEECAQCRQEMEELDLFCPRDALWTGSHHHLRNMLFKICERESTNQRTERRLCLRRRFGLLFHCQRPGICHRFNFYHGPGNDCRIALRGNGNSLGIKQNENGGVMKAYLDKISPLGIVSSSTTVGRRALLATPSEAMSPRFCRI